MISKVVLAAVAGVVSWAAGAWARVTIVMY
jgi:hypothetical protein